MWDLNLENDEYTKLWTLRYAQGNEWHEGTLTYNNSKKHVIIFEAVRGSGIGDISLGKFFFFSNI